MMFIVWRNSSQAVRAWSPPQAESDSREKRMRPAAGAGRHPVPTNNEHQEAMGGTTDLLRNTKNC